METEFLFDMPAVGLEEQRAERRRTIKERCEMAASLINATDQTALAWCHLNDEGDMLESLIPDAVQVAGSDSDERKEERLEAFADGRRAATAADHANVTGGLAHHLVQADFVVLMPTRDDDQM